MQAELGVGMAQFDNYRRQWAGSSEWEFRPPRGGAASVQPLYFYAPGWFAGFARFLLAAAARKQAAVASVLSDNGDGDDSLEFWTRELAKEKALKLADERLVREGQLLPRGDLDAVMTTVGTSLRHVEGSLCEACKELYSVGLDRIEETFASLTDGSSDDTTADRDPDV